MNKKHKIIYAIFHPLIILFLKIKFGYKFEKAKNLPENYIVLSNHVTDFDPLFVGASFKRQMYFVGSEHIARWKIAYKLLKFGFEPIIRYKGTVAATTVIDILRKLKNGDNICLFAEGVRTWDGVTCPILPSTGKMIKRCGAGLVTYKITGGYFIRPNWSEGKTRKGYIHGAPVNVYTKEDLANLSVDEINEIIKRDLYENAYERQMAEPKKYKGKNLAERMENLIFICPHCNEMETVYSEGDYAYCKNCDFKVRYNEYGMLEGSDFKTVKELHDWQLSKISEAVKSNTSFTSENAKLSTINDHVENKVDEGKTSISCDGIICNDTLIPLDDISVMDIHGRRAIVFAVDKTYYELVTTDGSNALKYLLYYREYNRINTGE